MYTRDLSYGCIARSGRPENPCGILFSVPPSAHAEEERTIFLDEGRGEGGLGVGVGRPHGWPGGERVREHCPKRYIPYTPRAK